jgi:hypothetical protein
MTKIENKINVPLPHYIGFLLDTKGDNSTGIFTIDVQEQSIFDFLDGKCGDGNYRITFVVDAGFSGAYGVTATNKEGKVSPTLREMTDMLEAGRYAGVIVYSLSRSFGNLRGFFRMVEDIVVPLKIPLMSATEHTDIFTADGRMFLYLKALLAEKARQDIKRRTVDAAASRVEDGDVSGQVGYGWTLELESDV